MALLNKTITLKSKLWLAGLQLVAIKYFVVTLLIISGLSVTRGQNKENIYVKLDSDKIEYKKSIGKRIVKIITPREVTGYVFTPKCECSPGGTIGFSGHDNPETGSVFEPIKRVGKDYWRSNKLTPFDDFIRLILRDDLEVNGKYNIFFVERSNKGFILYHVRLMHSLREE